MPAKNKKSRTQAKASKSKGQDHSKPQEIITALALVPTPPPDDKSPVRSGPTSPAESPVERSPEIPPLPLEDYTPSAPALSPTLKETLTVLPMKRPRRQLTTSPVVKVKNTILSEIPKLWTVEVGTNLNVPPSKYFASDQEWNAMIFSHKISTGFSSFAVTKDLEQHVGVTDFISDAENMKRLIKLPFSKQSISLLMHRVGNSILVDNFDLIYLYFRECTKNKESFNWKILSEYAKKVVEKQKDILLWEGRSSQQTYANQMLHKLVYHSRNEDFKFKDINVKSTSNCLEQPPDYTLAGSSTKFLHKISWEFSEFSFLLGSNVPCFKNSAGTTVTIRENDSAESSTVPALDGLDAWLDNVMLEAAETFFCHHVNGVVTKAEFVETQRLEDIGFNERTATEKSNKLLSLLKEKISEVGHSYWFYKAPCGDVFEITDLTNILPEFSPKVEIVNPIMPSIGTLLYRICETSSGIMPPTTVLSMMRHFLSIYPEDRYPLLSLSAIFWVLNSRLNYNMDIYHPEVKLLNRQTLPEITFEYSWKGDGHLIDIFNIKYGENSIPSDELEIYNGFNEHLDWDIWEQITQTETEQPTALDKFRTITRNGPSFPSRRSEFVCRFFPLLKSAPEIIKQIHLEMTREHKNRPNSPVYISTFCSHMAAYTVEIQKPLPLWLNDGALSVAPEKDIGKIVMRREVFCKKLVSKCTIKATKSIIDSPPPKPMDWIFYLTCNDLFGLFSTAFCLIEESFSAREKESSRKKGKQAFGPKDEQKMKHDLNKLFREKLALLFLSISYFAYIRRPSEILLGRFCVKWALFLNGDGVGTRAEVTSSAWKIAGDLLAATLGEETALVDFEKKLSTYDEIVLSTYPDLAFLCKMSQGNRKIQMVKYLKDYDNFYQKGTTESYMWMAYWRANDSAPDKFKDLVRREIAVAVGEASADCFQLLQVNFLKDGQKGNEFSISKWSDLIHRCDEIIEYFDWTLTKWPHKENLTHVIKMKIYQAEVKYFQQFYLQPDIDSLGKLNALEEVHDAFHQVEILFEAHPAAEYISPTVYDDISWRISCCKVEIAEIMYRNTPLRNSCKLKFGGDSDHFEKILQDLLTAEQSLKAGRCYPSTARQYIQLAKIYELRGLVYYTLARIQGWQPDAATLLELNKTKTLHGKKFCTTAKYLLVSKNSEGDDESVGAAKKYLEWAKFAFYEEAMAYLELGCFTEYVQAYLCYIDCQVALVEGIPKTSIELSLICVIRNHIPMHEISKNRCRLNFMAESGYNLQAVIGSSLKEALRPDGVQWKEISTVEMLERVARRLDRCVTALKLEGRRIFGRENLKGLVEKFDQKAKGLIVLTEEEAIKQLSNNMDKIAQSILRGGNDKLIAALDLKVENSAPIGEEDFPSVQGRGAGGDGPHNKQIIKIK